MPKAGLLKKVVVTLALTTAGTAYALEKPPANPIEPAILQNLEKFHGHTCAGSLMGARLGVAAKTALRAAGGEGRLKARYSSYSCPVDGIQITVGTTYGNRGLEVVDEKEHRLLLTAEKNGRQVEARLTRGADEKAKKFRELKGRAAELPVGAPERQRLEKSAEDLLVWFRTAPDAEVVQVRVVR